MLQPRAENRRLWREEARATLALAWPLILTNIAQSLIHLTDVVLLGWAGPNTLAAATLGVNIYFAFHIFGIGLVIATSPMIAKELGERRHSVRDVRRTVRQGMWAAVIFSAPVMVILWHSGAILVMLGQDPQLAAAAQQFVRALQWGFLPYLWYLVLRSFISALERPLWSFVVGVGAVIYNAIVNYGLIFGELGLPKLGLVGAGIGSASANLFMFAGMALVVTLHRRFRRFHLFGHFWRPDWQRLREVWRLGLPIAATFGLEITIFNAAVFLMGHISTAAIAAHAVAIQVAALTFMVPMGLSQAVTVRVGLAYGRRDPEGIARAGWTAFALTIGFMSAAAVAILLTAPRLVGLFGLDPSDPADAAVVPLAISFLTVAAFFQIFDGAQSVGAGMLRGLQDTRVPMLYAAFGYWGIGLFVAVALAFYAGFGGVGIWIGLAAGLAAVSVMMMARWLRRERLGLVRID